MAWTGTPGNGALTIDGNFTISKAGPAIFLYDSGGTADNRRVRVNQSSDVLRIQAQTDAQSGGGAVVDLERSGNNFTYMRLKSTMALVVGAPTGGDKGGGTVQAEGVYDDNTLLTCYVPEAYLDGDVDLARWDAFVPDKDDVVYDPQTDTFSVVGKIPRTHTGAARFKARLGGPEDPLDIDKFIAHWKTKRHITSMPNPNNITAGTDLSSGEWLQRIIEVLEIYAVHFDIINERLKAIGA